MIGSLFDFVAGVVAALLVLSVVTPTTAAKWLMYVATWRAKLFAKIMSWFKKTTPSTPAK